MNPIPYTYSVVKYVHDPAAGEVLNIGVVLWAPYSNYLGVKLEYKIERLSRTFVGFEEEQYKRVLRQLEAALQSFQARLNKQKLFPEFHPPEDVKQLIKLVWPDEDLSFQMGPMLAGVSNDLSSTLDQVFNRLVDSQYPHSRTAQRSDDEVWTAYNRQLVQVKATKPLVPKTISNDVFSFKFDHSFKNEKWHILQPVSMDYVRSEGLQKKASTWLGNATAMEGHPDLGTLYILLGKPRLKEHMDAYIRAKNLLHRMSIDHKLIEEDEAEQFAEYIANYMKQHGILNPEKD